MKILAWCFIALVAVLMITDLAKILSHSTTLPTHKVDLSSIGGEGGKIEDNAGSSGANLCPSKSDPDCQHNACIIPNDEKCH